MFVLHMFNELAKPFADLFPFAASLEGLTAGDNAC